MEKKDIDYIARHYRSGRFNAGAGWRKLGLASFSLRKIYRSVAAIATVVVISSAAALIYHNYHTDYVPLQKTEVSSISPMEEVKVIDFENAALDEVVRKIEDVYNVEVTNLPARSEDYELSLHYEGNPKDLIEVINDILNTQMAVVEK